MPPKLTNRMATIPIGLHCHAVPCASIKAVARFVAAFRWGATMDRILLVDDDVEVRPLLEHILLDNGYEVVTAEGVATATALLIAQPFDLVLCDVNSPDGSGLSIADK